MSFLSRFSFQQQLVAIFIFIGSIVVGGGFMYIEKSTENKKLHEYIISAEEQIMHLEEQIMQLEDTPKQTKIEKLEVEKKETPSVSLISTGSPCDRIERGRCVIDDFNVLTPNGGERLCLGDMFNITWKVPGDVESIKVILQNTEKSYTIGSFPATYNETGEKNTGEGLFPWTVGKTTDRSLARAGETYKIVINASYKGYLVADLSDTIFSVITCEG
jgi:hypothetical protein